MDKKSNRIRVCEKALLNVEEMMAYTDWGENITVSEWFEEFLILYKISRVKDTTLYRSRQTFSPCEKDVVGSMTLRDVRAVHIQQLINKLHKKGFAHDTLSLLKSLLCFIKGLLIFRT